MRGIDAFEVRGKDYTFAELEAAFSKYDRRKVRFETGCVFRATATFSKTLSGPEYSTALDRLEDIFRVTRR